MAEYHVENFGCRASRSDGEAIAATLRLRGLEPAANMAGADVFILNTCSVTEEADRSARAFLRRIRRENPAARVVVTGCYAQRSAAEVAALAGVDAVVGNSHKAFVAETALGLLSNADMAGFVPLQRLTAAIQVDESFAHSELAALPFAADARQTRPNLKAQDGCDNRCSFCIIPTTRGPGRSVGLEQCVEDTRRFVKAGGRELVLSGINLGRWGRDLQPPHRFEDLVAALLEQCGLPRLRLSSVEPMDWTAGLLELFREYAAGEHPRLARHAHLPLQSGSDAILRRMHRRYRPWHYAERLAQIREIMPQAAIGADVMVGFPGETDELFAESYRFIEAQPFTYLHLFPFSARPGTLAWELHREKPVPAMAVKERMAALRGLMERKSLTFRKGFAGQRLSAVTLQPDEGRDGTPALTDNFLKVMLDDEMAANALIHVEVTAVTEAGLRGVAEAVPVS
ncbi:MiaB/RimO family radical SAM methylthiotransferase [Paracidobacterium acidisoli]|uniref:MiaB/RimO family radical SAM methylthiotransferase n=1 Tax=Paracidobacterium acidisoli TaxID=2303751 RepID=UPI0018F1C750|nr:MiaB/RimO family radical SAM methylthiotransferase [Paracidobacterium acidisoli]